MPTMNFTSDGSIPLFKTKGVPESDQVPELL